MRLEPVYRITVFVPPEHLERLKRGILAVDPLGAGHYDQVMWTAAPGEEQFRPLAGADPALGRIGEVARAPSVRLEFAIARDRQLLQRMIEQGIHAHHPWEVPAVFVDEALFPVP
ncbi:hypothetical protein [Stenotrophomonas sp. MMGLT7]|uniref:hypothetical protein n=1 Tax=Stenotrophomonas sp. MMGLT7 TaxID=2901227 RepID=UPI001E43F424|nr:hypothetical protein [Stenotrophomonas sp. MMGLT7]MCD7100026.1 hypothetical protein [Stenotrophomonas sp. MMGLT7]